MELPCLLTHYAISYLLASRFVRKRCALLLALVGLLPDIDVLLRIHRWITHSLIIPLAVALVAIVAYKLGQDRWSKIASLTLISAIIYIVHIVLDLFTASTPILWPILDQSYAIKFDVEGIISDNQVQIDFAMSIETEPVEFIRRPFIEGPLASPTGAIIALAIAVYEVLGLRISHGRQGH